MRQFHNIVVAFEAPPWLLESPDVRITRDENNIVTYVFVKGCKACQQLSSKCACAARPSYPSRGCTTGSKA
jgi:hypothetical protein